MFDAGCRVERIYLPWNIFLNLTLHNLQILDIHQLLYLFNQHLPTTYSADLKSLEREKISEGESDPEMS